MGIPLGDVTSVFIMCFTHKQGILAQDHDDLAYVARKLVEEYKKWGMGMNVKEMETVGIEDHSCR